MKILIVEDDPDHAGLILDILDTEAVEGNVVIMKNGQEVIDYLQKTDIDSSHGRKPSISLIVLDLNLPKTNGMDILKSLKGNSRYCSIPVVILSTSSDPDTISEAYKNGVNGYVTKSINYDEYAKEIRSLIQYWSDINTLLPQI